MQQVQYQHQYEGLLARVLYLGRGRGVALHRHTSAQTVAPAVVLWAGFIGYQTSVRGKQLLALEEEKTDRQRLLTRAIWALVKSSALYRE